MGITKEQAIKIEDGFLDSIPISNDYSKETALKVLDAWNYLYSVMEAENNFSDHLGDSSIDWQIGNWANDTVEVVHNARLYEEEIRIQEQILKIDWTEYPDNLFHENAIRDMADAYACLHDYKKCNEIYEKYIKEDPLWGWGWIGYFRQLREQNDNRYEPMINGLYQKLLSGTEYRDAEDLCIELEDEFAQLGDEEKVQKLKELRENDMYDNSWDAGDDDYIEMNTPYIAPQKIYPNDPCPCGSGKKYKKCCGR